MLKRGARSCGWLWVIGSLRRVVVVVVVVVVELVFVSVIRTSFRLA
jgi:hypothetical protein